MLLMNLVLGPPELHPDLPLEEIVAAWEEEHRFTNSFPVDEFALVQIGLNRASHNAVSHGYPPPDIDVQTALKQFKILSDSDSLDLILRGLDPAFINPSLGEPTPRASRFRRLSNFCLSKIRRIGRG